MIRRWWHDLYYWVTGNKGARFALTCREAVEQVNWPEARGVALKRFRLKLHLSLCQACHNYFEMSRQLGRAFRTMVRGSDRHVDLERLNQDLLRRFGKPRGR